MIPNHERTRMESILSVATDYRKSMCRLVTHISTCYSSGGHIDQIDARFSVEDAVMIYHDPADPRRAVVKRGFTFSIRCAPPFWPSAHWLGQPGTTGESSTGRCHAPLPHPTLMIERTTFLRIEEGWGMGSTLRGADGQVRIGMSHGGFQGEDGARGMGDHLFRGAADDEGAHV